MKNIMPDFANASSVQGLGQMVAEYAATVEARLPVVETPAAPEAPVDEVVAPSEETPAE